MNKFTLGIATGIASLALAVPLLAQISSAASGNASSSTTPRAFPVPTQACVQAMVSLEDARLANFDAETEQRKTMMQAHRDALADTAAIADDAQRREAMQTMREQMRAGKENGQFTPPAAVTAAMEAVRTACGNAGMGMRGFGPGFGGPLMKGGMMGKRGMHGRWL